MIRLPPAARVMYAGIASAVVSTAAALVLSRIETGRATTPINAISHIVWGGRPPAGRGDYGSNLALGALLHFGANLFWAMVFETLCGIQARRSAAAAWSSGLAVAAAGYAVDYAVVPRRLRPGLETYLSRRSVLAVYAGLAAGYAWSALGAQERRRTLHRAGERKPSPRRAPAQPTPRF